MIHLEADRSQLEGGIFCFTSCFFKSVKTNLSIGFMHRELRLGLIKNIITRHRIRQWENMKNGRSNPCSTGQDSLANSKSGIFTDRANFENPSAQRRS